MIHPLPILGYLIGWFIATGIIGWLWRREAYDEATQGDIVYSYIFGAMLGSVWPFFVIIGGALIIILAVCLLISSPYLLIEYYHKRKKKRNDE
jgi:hypothetical protein